jgi:crotonobetainyl-CoA:carnitine CoA-transferase CaiB-like acyl-CoA transferase
MHEEVMRIFHQVLLRDQRLRLPQKVLDIASSTTIDDTTTTIAAPFIPAPLKFTESSSALWALAATYGNAIVKERFGIEQRVVVNTDVASLFLASSALCRVDGKSILDPGLSARYVKYDLGHMSQLWRRLCTNVYPTKDGRFFHLHGSMNANKSLAMLGLPKERPDLTSVDEVVREYTRSTSQLDSQWLDIEANEHWRQAGTICLSPDEFRASEQGKAISSDPLFLVKQSATDVLPPVPYATAQQGGTAMNKYRPLEGIKMIDISRVIAAPTIAKLAALFGATVVRVSCDSQPDMGPLLIDGNLGKYDVSLDLKSEAGRATLRDLVKSADVVLDGYRPGALERLGFGADYLHFLARQRGRGIIVMRENCYGWHGPWAQRSGWQQISDCVTGVSWLMGKFLGLDEPVVPPLPNSDYQYVSNILPGLMPQITGRF